MLDSAMLVTTIAVTISTRLDGFYADRLGLAAASTKPRSPSGSAADSARFPCRKGKPNVGQTVAPFRSRRISTG